MKLLTFSTNIQPPRPGLLEEDGVLPLPFDSMMELIKAGEKGLDAARNTSRSDLLPLSEVRIHAPIPRPSTLRDFYAFEQHVRTANQNRGREVARKLVQIPGFLLHQSRRDLRAG